MGCTLSTVSPSKLVLPIASSVRHLVPAMMRKGNDTTNTSLEQLFAQGYGDKLNHTSKPKVRMEERYIVSPRAREETCSTRDRC